MMYSSKCSDYRTGTTLLSNKSLCKFRSTWSFLFDTTGGRLYWESSSISAKSACSMNAWWLQARENMIFWSKFISLTWFYCWVFSPKIRFFVFPRATSSVWSGISLGLFLMTRQLFSSTSNLTVPSWAKRSTEWDFELIFCCFVYFYLFIKC